MNYFLPSLFLKISLSTQLFQRSSYGRRISDGFSALCDMILFNLCLEIIEYYQILIAADCTKTLMDRTHWFTIIFTIKGTLNCDRELLPLSIANDTPLNLDTVFKLWICKVSKPQLFFL